MPVHIALAHTPSRESRPLVHPISHHGPTIHPIHLCDAIRHPNCHTLLTLDPRSGTACIGSYVFSTGSGLRVARHIRSNHLVVDHPRRGIHLTLSTTPSIFAVVYGQLALFCAAPRGFFLLAPMHVGAVSVVFSAVVVNSGTQYQQGGEKETNQKEEEEEENDALEIVAVRQTRVKDLRFAGADYLPERTSRLLRSSPPQSSSRTKNDDENETTKKQQQHYLPSHPHVLTPRKAFWQSDVFHAVYPLCTPLSALLSSASSSSALSLTSITRIISQLLQALAHLHSHGVVHGHITRDHVLLDNNTGTALLTGFGHAVVGTSQKKRKGRASLLLPDVDVHAPVDMGLYANSVGRDAMPPGVTRRTRRAPCNDVWAVGVVLYALLNGGDVSDLHSKESREAMVKVAVGGASNGSGESCASMSMSMSQTDMGSVLNADTLLKQVSNFAVNHNYNDINDDVENIIKNDENVRYNNNAEGEDNDNDEHKQRELIVSLLRGLLQPNPRKRLSARAALEHPALAQHSSSSSSSSISPSPEQEQQQEDSTILQQLPTGENINSLLADMNIDVNAPVVQDMVPSAPCTPTSITMTATDEAVYQSNTKTQFRRAVKKVNKVVILVSALQLQAGTGVNVDNTAEMVVGARVC